MNKNNPPKTPQNAVKTNFLCCKIRPFELEESATDWSDIIQQSLANFEEDQHQKLTTERKHHQRPNLS